MVNKLSLRQVMRQRKQQMTIEERAYWSSSICQYIITMSWWQNARTIMIYNALPDEVDLSSLMRQAWKEGKRVLLPVVVHEDLEIRLVNEKTIFTKGAFGINEPVGEAFDALEELDLILVPGVAFDANGGRLGRGKGYYDRFLALCPRAYRVGVCFPFQYIENVPMESHDFRMDMVLTV